MKKALAGFFVFAAYLQSDGVVAAERDCPAHEVAVGSECVKLDAHPHPHEGGSNDEKDAEERAPDAAPHEGEDVKIIIDKIVKDAVGDAVKER
jgi:hypothetical protein